MSSVIDDHRLLTNQVTLFQAGRKQKSYEEILQVTCIKQVNNSQLGGPAAGG
jgi:hypothetical protein